MTEGPPILRPPEVGATWGDARVAASYAHRVAYPPQTFEILAGLIVDEPRAVLDLGCGTGYAARPLARLVERVDAVDISAAMIAEGKRLPGGDNPRITWIVGRAEDAPLRPPYALVTAGDSLHWMDWTVVLPRIADVLSPAGHFAILDVNGTVIGDNDALREGRAELVRRYSTYTRPDIRLGDEIERRGLFQERGRAFTEPVVVRQTVVEYVESFHASSALSWERMRAEDAAAFDAEFTELVLAQVGEMVELSVQALVVWGKPAGGHTEQLPRTSSGLVNIAPTRSDS